MSDPVRLRDDAATPKAQKRLLRNEPALDVGYDVEQGLSRFRHSVEPGSAVRRHPHTKALAALSSVWLWIALPAAATGLWAVQRASATRHDVLVSPPRAHTAAPRPAEPVVAPERKQAPAIVTSAARAEEPVAPPPSRKSAPEARDSQLLAETEHMAELRHVAAADPARALAQAEQGARQFPRGFFAQEREAISITSLLRLGRTAEARARGERFLARHPQGPAAEQIRRAIGQD